MVLCIFINVYGGFVTNLVPRGLGFTCPDDKAFHFEINWLGFSL